MVRIRRDKPEFQLSNFEDFLRANPKFRKYVDEHDQLIEKLTEQCRKAFESLDASPLLVEAGQKLEKYDGVLIKKLEDLRFELCQKYDVPAAPIPYGSQVG